MKDFLTPSELEKEFLGRLEIYKNGNVFYHNNDKFICSKANYGPVKLFGSRDKFVTYQYKGKGGTITFLRSDHVYNDAIPSVIVDFKYIIIAFGEMKVDGLYLGSKEELTEEMENILNNINRITIQIKYKHSTKYQSKISICPNYVSGITFTSLSKNLDQIALIESGMSSIDNVYLNSRESHDDLSTESYSELLKSDISKVYSDDKDLADLHKLFIPLFSKVHEATLYLPSMNEEYLRIHMKNNRNSCVQHCDEIIVRATEDKNKELDAINRREKMLDNIISKYSVNKGTQK